MLLRRLSAVVTVPLLTVGLMGCQPEDGALDASTQDGAVQDGAQDPKTDGRLAPDVLDISGIARWNGLQTARGAWIAHPAARTPRTVRVFNEKNGQTVDAIVYRPSGVTGGNIVTISSDAANALGIDAGSSALVKIVALRQRPKTASSTATAEDNADKLPIDRIAEMDEGELLHLIAALLRGLGYATLFEGRPLKGWPESIDAVPPPDVVETLPPLRVAVWPGGRTPLTKLQVSLLRVWVGLEAKHGLVVSIPGYTEQAKDALQGRGAWLNLMDGDALLNVWRARYSALWEPDQALLVLELDREDVAKAETDAPSEPGEAEEAGAEQAALPGAGEEPELPVRDVARVPDAVTTEDEPAAENEGVVASPEQPVPEPVEETVAPVPEKPTDAPVAPVETMPTPVAASSDEAAISEDATAPQAAETDEQQVAVTPVARPVRESPPADPEPEAEPATPVQFNWAKEQPEAAKTADISPDANDEAETIEPTGTAPPVPRARPGGEFNWEKTPQPQAAEGEG